MRAGASSVSTETALGRQSPRPARSVSSACRAGSSSSPTAAATPPWARRLVDARSGPFVSTRTSPSAAAHSAAKSPATPPPTTTSASSVSRPVSPGSLMVVFASKSITSWLSLPPRPHAHTAPAHVVLAVVFQVRDGALCVLLWERAREPFSGSWALPGGTLVAGETLESRSSATSRRRSTSARSPTSSSSGRGASPTGTPSAGSSRPPTSASCRSGSIRACRPTRLASGRRAAADCLRPRRDRARGPGSPARQALVHEHRLRARARRRSRSPSCATSTTPRSATRSRRRTSSACSSAAVRRVGREAPRARAGGRPTRRALPLPRAPARGHRPVRRAAPAAVAGLKSGRRGADQVPYAALSNVASRDRLSSASRQRRPRRPPCSGTAELRSGAPRRSGERERSPRRRRPSPR